MEPEGSLPHSQASATCLYAGPAQSSPYNRIPPPGDRWSYTVLRGRWHNIIVVNVHAPSQKKSDESKDSFYEELEQVFDQFPNI